MSADPPPPGISDEGAPWQGHRLGRYTLVSRVARGGMAEIFLAQVADLPGVQRTVVIKRVLPELARDPEHGRMFLDEARIMASLVHPNVVQVVEVGREGDELFIAMEHIDGVSLSSLMEAGRPLPLGHAVHIVAGALAGLHYVHERRDGSGNPMQLIHRDISPRNVLVTRQGAVKLIDFGIARQGNRLGQTRSGIVKGTIPYMSPEQCRGLHLDRRTDIFSTGILLWELTVGRRLFEADSDFDVLRLIVEGELPPPRSLSPDYPAALEEVVLRALARSPADRFQEAGQMLDALEATARQIGLAPSARALEAWLAERIPASRPPAAAEPATAEGAARHAAGESVAAPPASAPGASRNPEAAAASANAAPAPPAPSTASLSHEALAPGRRRRASAAVVAVVSLAGLAGAALSLRSPSPPAVQPPSVAPAKAALAPPPNAAPAPPVAPSATAAAPTAPPPPPHEASSTPATTPPPPLLPAHPAHGSAHAAPSGGHPSVATDPAAPAPVRGEGEIVLDAVPWCHVAVDGVRRGDTPLQLKVPAGPHTVRLDNDEFGIDRTVTLTVEPGKAVRRNFKFPVGGAP